MSTFTPTPEQQDALEKFATGQSLRIVAGAGTGKTSTLRLLAENAAPGTRLLYMAYNKAIQVDASREFPHNTKVVTSHALAFRAVGRRYKHRLNSYRQPAQEQARVLGVRGTIDTSTRKIQPAQQARWAMQMVNRFCASADPTITTAHLPTIPGLEPGEHTWVAEQILPRARAAWEDLVDLDGRLRFDHDVYLKLYALTDPILDQDVIAYDEAQDATPVTAQIVARQQEAGKQVVIVGDSSQAIYAWRGAVDSMGMFDCAHTATLSKSFRFGPAIAAEANQWLTWLDAPLRLTGHEPRQSKIVTGLFQPDAVLCRSNVGAITELLQLQAANVPTAIVGGGSDLRALAEAAESLKAGAGTSHPELAAFQSWGAVQEYAGTEEGADLKAFVDVIDSYTPRGVVAAIDRCVDEDDARSVISTAHKAKGREWDRVRIADDFHEPDENGPSAEEAMLAYVSVTRAKKQLDRGPLSWIDKWVKDGQTTQPRKTPAARVSERADTEPPAAVDGSGWANATPVPDQKAGTTGWATATSPATDLRPCKVVLVGADAAAARDLAEREGLTVQGWVQAQIAKAAASRA